MHVGAVVAGLLWIFAATVVVVVVFDDVVDVLDVVDVIDVVDVVVVVTGCAHYADEHTPIFR